MANLITTGRLLMLFALVGLACGGAPRWQLLDAPLLVLIILLDAVDGHVARVRGEATQFGAIFDIAADRVVETVLWIVLAYLGLVPLWVPIVFVTRGAIVDSIRHGAAAQGETAFGMMRSPLGRQLVAGRFMRGLYGALKAVTFGWIFLLQPWPRLDPALWALWSGALERVTAGLVMATVVVCLLRGLPVVVEFAMSAEIAVRPLGSRRSPRLKSWGSGAA